MQNKRACLGQFYNIAEKKSMAGTDFWQPSKIFLKTNLNESPCFSFKKNHVFSEKGLDKFSKNRYYIRKNAAVAQLVERWTENPYVVGSIPTGGKVAFHNATFFMPNCFCPV